MTGRERLVLAITQMAGKIDLEIAKLAGLREALALYDESQRYHDQSVVARCQSMRTKPGEGSGGIQEQCTATRHGDGTLSRACDDPCRFVMGKDGTDPARKE